MSDKELSRINVIQSVVEKRVDQGQIVDNKRLGAVLKLAQSKMDELERDGKRDRSKKMPKRRAQARVQEQLRAINPVLANPEEFRASLKR
ncbi:TPA: hypothetical protein MYJ99_004423 [Klebsiella pneumoniae]|nr:hypothetical protein [Klebsiella pneumoniae]HDF5691539.1 hypothetical protein [Klebsiella variicola]